MAMLKSLRTVRGVITFWICQTKKQGGKGRQRGPIFKMLRHKTPFLTRNGVQQRFVPVHFIQAFEEIELLCGSGRIVQKTKSSTDHEERLIVMRVRCTRSHSL